MRTIGELVEKEMEAEYMNAIENLRERKLMQKEKKLALHR